ncbi:MAG TPA: acyltransferase [Abditibacteriaceae bacterium]|jgi:acetyltransferase-like isoleucine patch superfamily enzyme
MGELKVQLRWALPMWLIGLLTNWWPDNRISVRLRGMMAAPFIGKCGKGFQLGANVTLLNAYNLQIGDNCYIARGCWLNAMSGLTIEDEVIFGPYVVISTMQHVFKDGSVRFGGSIKRPVRIGRGSWLASHCSVKCGVTIGRGSLVAANACVVKDVPDSTIVGGVPAKVLGPNTDGEAEVMSRFG